MTWLCGEAQAAAESAIESLNVNVATASIELATTIAPDDDAVRSLAARVATLEQVVAHIEAGDQALALDQFQKARAEYRKAVDLDPSHQRAARSLASAGSEVTASVFRGHMSRGFAALEARDYDGARSAFREAGRIRPGDSAVNQALAQVDNRESADRVGQALRSAADLEAKVREFLPQYRRGLVVTDGVFSMDGALAPLDRIRALADRYDALLMVDCVTSLGGMQV